MTAREFSLQEPIHAHRLRVLYGDTDAGGVVYYANYLRFCEAGRTEFMRELVVSYRSLEERGIILPVVDCRVRYKASARYDDLLTVETSLVEIKAVSCRFNYRLSDEQGRLLALAYTTHATVDRQGKLTRLPTEIIAGLQKIAATP
ncbi:acyl-CoA thioesterase [Desulfurivibrio dismutans]|uniref:acyl-CoA thioesterase n=1 Tax=Desulfurivibrio dismutans TaxID=1398908 RepID=UPI0023D9ECF5|nr:thioesterase family protein [Desulfurivibrio alkaliphilus]MDF1615264.1 thioesterase family protein [Desulfurivibrio alkaliphilus]